MRGDGGPATRWTVEAGEAGRLDRHVAARLGVSRSRAAALIAAGLVVVNGSRARKSRPVAGGDQVEAELPEPVAATARPQDIPLDIVFEDEEVAVIDKPAGMVVHPAPGHPDGTLVNALLHHMSDLSGIGGELRPGIVHRLDRDTSGLMAVAKTDRAHAALSGALRERRVTRIYLAALWGAPRQSALTVDQPVGRHPRDRLRMAVVEGGREARTHFRLIESWRAASFCEARLDTGRTHQIRVHAAAIGHPVVGDSLYGAGREKGFAGPQRPWAAALARRTPRQFLHARELGFAHPVSGAPLSFESPLPPDLATARAWALAG